MLLLLALARLLRVTVRACEPSLHPAASGCSARLASAADRQHAPADARPGQQPGMRTRAPIHTRHARHSSTADEGPGYSSTAPRPARPCDSAAAAARLPLVGGGRLAYSSSTLVVPFLVSRAFSATVTSEYISSCGQQGRGEVVSLRAR